MSAVAEHLAQDVIRGTFGVIYDCLGVTPVFDDELDALAAGLAPEIDMCLSAAVVMADWTYPIGVEC